MKQPSLPAKYSRITKLGNHKTYGSEFSRDSKELIPHVLTYSFNNFSFFMKGNG